MKQYKWYTGVGSAETPLNIQEIMAQIATKLAQQKIGLRSGGRYGAESAFGRACDAVHGMRQFFWAYQTTPESRELAERYHPDWNSLNGYYQLEEARGVHQVIGMPDRGDQPSISVICWTPDGAISHQERTLQTGRTGTAISIATHFNVPVFNLKREDHLNQWIKWLEK